MNIFVVAGEASADHHVSHLVHELKETLGPARFYGVGGPGLEKEGAEIIVQAKDLGLVGLFDWIDRFPSVWANYRKLVNTVSSDKPDLAILSDLPDLNLKLAKRLKALGVPVIYYISPQVWAWRQYRTKKIRRYVDQMLVIFPFEEEFYEQRSISAKFVGHPMVGRISKRTNYRDQRSIEASPRIAILPGSRMSELRNHRDLLFDFRKRLLEKYPNAEFRIPVAPTLDAKELEECFPGSHTKVESIAVDEVLMWADIAVVAFGTAVLEAALSATPTILFYKMSSGTAWFIRHFIRYKGFFGMPNILCKKEVLKEFIQTGATSEALLAEATHLIQDEKYRTEMVTAFRNMRVELGQTNASRTAAVAVKDFWAANVQQHH